MIEETEELRPGDLFFCGTCVTVVTFLLWGYPGTPILQGIHQYKLYSLSLFWGFTIENGYPTYCSSINWGFLGARLT